MGTDSDFPIIQYADDTLIIMEGCEEQLASLKGIFDTFASSTGIKVNFSKSLMVPVNITEERLFTLANCFGCSTRTLPFTYLGLPLGTVKPTIQEFLPLVKKCKARLLVTSNMLSQAGKLIMVNSVISSLPTFLMSTMKLPITIIKQIDKYRKHCLWRGSDINSKKPPKAAWRSVCLSKEEGGLGVLDLRTHNEALLLKSLRTFFNRENLPWVSLVWDNYYKNGSLPSSTKKGSFWWRDLLKLLDQYKELASSLPCTGSSVYL